MLNDLFETKNIERFLKDRGEESPIKPRLMPKFHQQVFTQSTLRYNTEEKFKLFIWGAVPRSGKSYMIADFISKNKYRPIGEQNNDIVLILGAKSETECQFIKMFCDLADFNDYGIISASTGISKSCVVKECDLNPKKPKGKNIYIFSQEWFKKNKIHTVNENTGPINTDMTLKQIQDILTALNKPIQNEKGKKYIKKELLKLYINKPNKSVIDQGSQFDKKTVIQKFAKLFEKRKIDLFFDEIHKGGSTNNSENILYAFVNAGVKIDIFIMVTATFAKPNLRYNSFRNIDTNNRGLKIIEWGYEDQQNMKQVTNNTNEEIMINSRSVKGKEVEKEVEKEVMQNIFQKYKDEYGQDNYLKIIAEEYGKHPQLVLIQPEQINPKEYVDVRNIFERPGCLSCNACKREQSLTDLRNPNKIFANPIKVNEFKKLFSFIGNRQSDEIGMPHLDSKCVYAHLAKMGAPIHTPHSELWFLPDKDLYDNDDDCRFGVCSKATVKKDSNNDEDDNEKTGLPNIEPLTRGLAFLLMSDSYFKEMYNVLIVHNTDIEYQQGNVKLSSDDIFGDPDGSGPIYHAIGTKSLSESIKMVEQKTFNHKKPKSLIILTGAKLRLGISLPCVDIAFNFDNISSVDNNYQTMFRVLTERTYQSKPYGYYIDFNKDRAINFLYDYNNTYGAGKRIADFKTKTEYLHSLLILFNYNGLGLIKQDTNKQLKLYNQLINDLELDEKSYQDFNLGPKNIENMVKKALLDVDMNLLKELKETVNFSYDKQSKSVVRVSLVEGNQARTAAAPEPEPNVDPDPNEGEEDEDEDEDEDDDDLDDNALIINAIAQILPPIVALLALFSNKNNYNCETLDDCIENCKTNLDQLLDLCSCDGDKINNSSILACYMKYQSVIPYTKTQLKHLLDTIQRIIKLSEQLNVNLNIIFDNIRNSMGKNDNPLISDMTAEKIQEKIEQYLPVREAEKQQNGEVFTPIELIDDMLAKLPKNVWEDPTLTWLDPANGIGNFPMVVYRKLMGYDRDDKDENKRCKGLPDKYNAKRINYSGAAEKSNHIIKKMLYMCELNPKNIKISRRIFGSNANICCCDFLKGEHIWRKQFKMEGEDDKRPFNIIFGNPPYNAGATGKSGEKHLDDAFINKSLELLIDDDISYLLFVTKTGWRSINSSVYENVIGKQIVYIKTYDFKNKPFKENLIPCYFLIKNAPKTDKTTFEYLDLIEDSEIIDGMNIYFLYRPYLNYLNILKKKYGNLKDIVRSKKESGSEYLLISFSTPEVLIKKVAPAPKDDHYYVITNPNSLMKYFFQSNIYKEIREYGRFSGFSTPKDIFYDIPNFNKITTLKDKQEVLARLKKFSEKTKHGLATVEAKTAKKPLKFPIKKNKITIRLQKNQKQSKKKGGSILTQNQKQKGTRKNKRSLWSLW